MRFKAFFFGLPVGERESFAQRANTTRGLLTQLAYENKQCELGLADVLVALSEGGLTLDDLPLTENARTQRAIREASTVSAAPAPREPYTGPDRRRPESKAAFVAPRRRKTDRAEASLNRRRR